jgi:hypothetical protein
VFALLLSSCAAPSERFAYTASAMGFEELRSEAIDSRIKSIVVPLSAKTQRIKHCTFIWTVMAPLGNRSVGSRMTQLRAIQ